MFAARFFGAAYFGPHYWGKSGTAVVVVPCDSVVSQSTTDTGDAVVAAGSDLDGDEVVTQ